MHQIFKYAHRLRNLSFANAEFMRYFIEVYTTFDGTSGDRTRQLNDMYAGFNENLARINQIVAEIKNNEFKED
jgi:hypothetical protein